jgi:ABC-type arginine transport system permease subunit
MDEKTSIQSKIEKSKNTDVGMIIGCFALITTIMSLAIGAIIGVVGLFFSISSLKKSRKRKSLIGIILNSLPILLMVIVIYYTIYLAKS